jgi:hypothetical protein
MPSNYQTPAVIIALGLLALAILALVVSVVFGVDISRLFI